MRRPIALAVSTAVLFGLSARILRADDLGEQVRETIDRGVAFLKGRQHNDGSWTGRLNPVGGVGQSDGVSALCTLALVNSGVEPDDQRIQQALGHLRKLKPKATYVVALQTMVFCQAEPKTDLLRIRENVKWLESIQVQGGPNLGAWAYGASFGDGDNSNSQFALLALHEAQRVGVPVQNRTWRLAKAYWGSCQHVDGSWGYKKDERHPGTGSMTCAGIASMIITSDRIRQANAKADGDRIACCVRTEDENDRIENGLQWLGRNFSVARNPNNSQWRLYYLYGLERVGRLSARRFIGGHDWYREGCAELVKAQDRLSGFIKGIGYAEQDPLIGTSLALLFLSKGRRPPLLAKLKHPPADDWNQHRSDVDNLTRFVETRWPLDLTWQTIDLDAAKVEDLLQVPVVYLCGSGSPLPEAADRQRRLARKLRDYLDRGGFLFAEGYRGGSPFDQGFRQLVEQVFPEPEYRLRLLEPEHPIWHAEQPVAADQLRPLWGVEFGCRTSVVYAPPEGSRPSLSCLWELSRGGREQTFTPKVQAQVDAALAIGINVLAYATNRELQSKDQLFQARPERPREAAFVRGRMSIAKLRHSGGCNAAPRALVTLLETAGEKLDVRVDTRDYLIYLTSETLFEHHMVFMHGRNRFQLTDDERKQLKAFVERGGILFADSICASSAFTESFRREMSLIFPDRKLEPIAIDDPLLTDAYGGSDLKVVTRRDPQARSGKGPLQAKLRKVAPELEGIRFDDRWGVVFSKYDISCALEKHDSLQCRGYVRQDAARIGLNVILYSLQQ